MDWESGPHWLPQLVAMLAGQFSSVKARKQERGRQQGKEFSKMNIISLCYQIVVVIVHCIYCILFTEAMSHWVKAILNMNSMGIWASRDVIIYKWKAIYPSRNTNAHAETWTVLLGCLKEAKYDKAKKIEHHQGLYRAGLSIYWVRSLSTSSMVTRYLTVIWHLPKCPGMQSWKT